MASVATCGGVAACFIVGVVFDVVASNDAHDGNDLANSTSLTAIVGAIVAAIASVADAVANDADNGYDDVIL